MHTMMKFSVMRWCKIWDIVRCSTHKLRCNVGEFSSNTSSSEVENVSWILRSEEKNTAGVKIEWSVQEQSQTHTNTSLWKKLTKTSQTIAKRITGSF